MCINNIVISEFGCPMSDYECELWNFIKTICLT